MCTLLRIDFWTTRLSFSNIQEFPVPLNLKVLFPKEFLLDKGHASHVGHAATMDTCPISSISLCPLKVHRLQSQIQLVKWNVKLLIYFLYIQSISVKFGIFCKIQHELLPIYSRKNILIRSFVFGFDFSFEKFSLVWFYFNLTTPLNCECVISFMYGPKMTNEDWINWISIQSGTRHSCCEMSSAEERGKQEMCLVQKKKERKEEGRICCRRGDRERPCRLSTCRRFAPLLPVLTPSNRTLQALAASVLGSNI